MFTGEPGNVHWKEIKVCLNLDGYLEIGTYPMPSAVPSEQSTAPGKNGHVALKGLY